MRCWLLLTALAFVAWFGVQAGAQRPSPDGDAVKAAPVSRPAGEAPGVRGATYYALENRTRRLTTEFLDGTRSVADRGTDGDVVARLEGRDRNEINRVRVDRMEGADDVAELALPVGPTTSMLIRADVHPTLDWASRQGHQFYVDKVASVDTLQWRNSVARRRGGPDEVHELHSVRAILTEWPDGLSAVTTPVHTKEGGTFQGRPVGGDVLVTKVMKDGAQVGIANYFTRERLFTWQIGTSNGTIAAEHLQSRYGGWLFTPDMVWMNLQSLALYDWKSAIDRDQFVTRTDAPSMLQTLSRFIAPSLEANEPGCDGLHWLDGSVFRFCCDMHDRCYSKHGCSSRSWWQFWSSWTCDLCNGAVVFCFTAGAGGPFYQSPW